METHDTLQVQAAPPPAPPGAYPALGIQIEDEFANIAISFGPGTHIVQAVTSEQMNDMCHKWLSRHKKLETH